MSLDNANHNWVEALTHPLTQMSRTCYVLIGLHLTRSYVGLPRLPFFLFLTPKPMYNTIWQVSLVRYELAVLSCTIWTGSSLLYDINLGATHTMILSIRGVMIPIYLVSSTTDSIRQHVVLFKAVPILTSDLKSEFLCQSSPCCAEPANPLNHLVHLEYLPCLHPPCITLTLRILVVMMPSP